MARARLAHRRALGEVVGRMVEVELVDAQVGVDAAGELVDRRPAAQEVLHHLAGDFRRIGRHAARRRRHGCRRTPRCAAARPAGWARPCQAASHSAISSSRPSEPGGLVSSVWRLHDLGLGFQVGSRQVAQDAAHFVESRAGFGGVHRGRGPSYICPIMTSPSEPPIARAMPSLRRMAAGLQGAGHVLHRRSSSMSARRAGSWPTCCRCCRSSALASGSRPGWCSPSCAASGRAGWRPCSRSARRC